MLKHSKVVIISAAGLLLTILPVLAKSKPQAFVQAAEIENTGSTNTVGYQLTILSDGSVVRVYTSSNTPVGSKPWVGQTILAPPNVSSQMVIDSRHGNIVKAHLGENPPEVSKFFEGKTMVKLKPISIQEAGKFFADLNAALPLTSLPVRHGMRSASFGTATFITYKGQKSPDLTFASDPRTAALKADIETITQTLGVGNAPRRPVVILHQYHSNEPTPQFQERF